MLQTSTCGYAPPDPRLVMLPTMALQRCVPRLVAVVWLVWRVRVHRRLFTTRETQPRTRGITDATASLQSIHGTCVELGSTGKYDGSHAYTFLRPRDVGGARRHVAHPQWL